MTTAEDHPASPQLSVLRHWDAQALETIEITPRAALSTVILWECFPDMDGGVPACLAEPLAAALTELGEVCFRLRDHPAEGVRLVGTVKSSRWPLSRSWDIVGTREVTAAEALFASGWAQGDKVGIVGAADDDRVISVLATPRFGEIVLTDDELLVAAIVDGAGMLIAASDESRLEEAIAIILRHCRIAGVEQARARRSG